MDPFDKIIGYASIKKELSIFADMLRNGEKYARLGISIPRGILLNGDPGVGKTLMANCLMEASGRKTFIVRKADANGNFVKIIHDTFEQAKVFAPSVVLLDDMDKFSSENGDKNAEEYVTIQSCMDNCKDSDIFVIATANTIRNLPDSLKREGRLGRIIDIRNPNGQDAVDIVRSLMSQKPFVENIDVAVVARMLNGRSCADLEAIINEAGIYAASQGKSIIDMYDLMRGTLRIRFNAPESIDSIPDNVLLATAFHEAGHAVVSETLQKGSVCLVSVLAHEGRVQGFTEYFQDDRYWDDVSNMKNRIIACLGGKAATEIVYGKTDVGVGSDLQRAYDIAERIVFNYCSTSFDSFDRHDSGIAVRNRKDTRISFLIETSYAQAKQIIAENRSFLDAVAHALVQKKTLVSSDIQQIKNKIANYYDGERRLEWCYNMERNDN